MRALHLLSLLITCSALACGGAIQIDPSGGDERAPPADSARSPSAPPSSSSSPSAVDAQPHPTTQCSTIEPGDGEEVVACGFPEDVSLVGATAEHLAIASRSRPSSSELSLMIHRLDRSNAALEQLVDSKATSSGTPLPVGFSGAAAGVVVWNGWFDHSSALQSDMLSIELGSKSARTLAHDTNGFHIVTSATAVYWDGYQGATSSIFKSSLHGAVPGKATFATQGGGGTLTVGVALGYVYYFAASSAATKSVLMRKPESDDGYAETLLYGLPSMNELGNAGATAVDADGIVYFAKSDRERGGFDVFGVDAAGLRTIAVCKDPEVCPQPAWLKVHEEQIVVGRMTMPLGWWNGFMRLPKRPALPVAALSPAEIAQATVQLDGDSMGGVVFEKGRFVVAYRRANTSMGVVASRVLP